MTNEKIDSYRDLRVWREAIELVKCIYRLTATMPQSEKYGLCSQIQRAAVSIPSNIAEGHARHFIREYLQHISISIGSLAEVQTQLVIIEELEIGNIENIHTARLQGDKVGKMLHRLKQSLRQRALSNTQHLTPNTYAEASC